MIHQSKPKILLKMSPKKSNKNQSSNSKSHKRNKKNVNRKQNPNNQQGETLKNLYDLTSFIDNETTNEFINIENQHLSLKMNNLNLNNNLIDNSNLNQTNQDNLNFNKKTQDNLILNFNQQKNQQKFKNKSRLPFYAGKQTYSFNSPFNFQVQQSISTNNFRSDSRLSNSSIVPSEVSNIHNSHLTNCLNTKSSKKINSEPNSLLPTPSVSSPPTPSESRRSSKQHNFKTKQQLNTTLNKNTSIKKSNLNNKAFRFEEYMPLCKVQNMLSKGQIVEGVLRINQRNFEDAYISAPGQGEADIRIFGKKNINRALNNDLVAVLINPINEWNILFNAIETNWANWKDEIIDILDAKKACLANELNEQCLDGEYINFDDTLAKSFNEQIIEEEEEEKSDISDKNSSICSDEYESAQEDFVFTNSCIDDRIYLTEEFFPNEKEFDFSVFQKKNSSNKSKQNTDNHSYTDGLNIRLLKPQDLIHCSFYKSCLQQTGKVVNILESSSNKICSGKLKLQSVNSEYVVFETIDKRIPNFLVFLSDCPRDFQINSHFYKNSLFLGEIKKWPATSRYPFGKLIKMVGSAGEIDTETEVLLVENNVDFSDFPSNIEHGLPITPNSETFIIPAKELKKRRDLRNELVFTIDPATARDLDDALSIKCISRNPLGEQIFEVGVHIADVSYFVKENLPIDKVAKHRTTSIYCVQKVIPMLPRILWEKYCSLNPGEEKLTFSVFWHMNSKGEILKEWFERTVIKSAIKLSYEIAADMIEKADLDWDSLSEKLPELKIDKFSYNEVAKSVNLLKSIATNLRIKRFKHGSIEIVKPEIRFVLDETRYNVLGFTTDKPNSTFLVEEFMLLANISVAKKIYSKFPEKSFLRRHPLPDKKMIDSFEDLCKNSGLKVDTSNSKQLQSCLNEIKKVVDDDSYKFLSLKLLKTMRPAEYFSTMKINNFESFTHYALCVPIYTHFTSPIRRYPDVIVHRLLAAALNLEKEPKFKKTDLDKLVKRCNEMKLANRIVGETSQKLFLSIYILSVGSIEQSAIVMQVLDKSFDCFLTKLNVTMRIRCDHLDLDRCEYNKINDSLKLFYSKESQNFVLIKILSKINLKITIPDKTSLLKWNAILV